MRREQDVHSLVPVVDPVHAVLNEMKEHRILPNIHTYELLMKAYLMQGSRRSALKALEDMKLLGLKPTPVIYNNLLMVSVTRLP